MMRRTLCGLVVVLLALPALRADDQPKDDKKPPTPRDQYSALIKEYNDAMQEYFKAIREAKTDEERKKSAEKMPKPDKYAPRFLAIAQENAKDDVAVDALVWVVSNGARTTDKSLRTKAIEQLTRDHITSAKIGRVCQMIGSAMDKQSNDFLRAVLEKNPNKGAKAEAILALVQGVRQKAMLAERVKSDAQLSKQVEEFLGKETLEELRNADAAKFKAEADKIYKDLAENYLADMDVNRVVQLCQQMSFSADASGESLLRTVLEKDKRKEAQGVACVSLAGVLKSRADAAAEKDPKASADIRAEAKKLYERCEKEFGDVKMGFRGTIKEKVKSDLYELEHLSIGMTAPDVAGEDQDGKKFSLADYKGKVVLLDFWSQF